jgi:hypothetical protein
MPGLRVTARISWCVLACRLFSSSPLWAQASVNETLAETLFREGRQLMQAGDYEHACPKLAESQRLDPATGALLNLAACHEAQGLVATAWLEYTEASSLARRAGESDRQQLADERVQALAAILPRLAVSITPQAGAEQIGVTLDGTALGAGSLGVAVPVDPGTHTIVAAAPGKKTWSQQVTLKASEPPVSVTVPALEPDPATAPAPPPNAPAAVAVRSEPAPPVAPDRPSRPLSLPIYLTGAATILCAGGAIATGVVAHTKAQDYHTLNVTSGKSEAERQAAHDEAHTWQVVNTALTGAAIAGAAATTILFFTRPARAAHTAFVPWVSPDGAGIAAVGRL